MMGFVRRLFGGGEPAQPPSAQAMRLTAELKDLFGHYLEFALLRFGKKPSDRAMRRAALSDGMLVYLAEFSLPDLGQLKEGSDNDLLSPLSETLVEVFAASRSEGLALAEVAIRLRGIALAAMKEAEDAGQLSGARDFDQFGKHGPLIEGIGYGNLARDAYDGAGGAGWWPDEHHLLAFSTLVGRAWLADGAAD